MQASAIRFELAAVEPGGLGAHEDEWRAFEDRTPADPFATFDWLDAWAKAYGPHRLALVRALEGDELAALGLLELASGGRWYFAGRPVSNYRGLLCRQGAEAAVWRGFGEWIGSRPPGCAVVSAEGLDRAAADALSGARRTVTPFVVLELPGDFETYLAQRSGSTRQTFRQRMRRLEKLGGSTAEAGDVEASLRTFLRLHAERAASKGERHEQVDERLLSLLSALSGRSLRLRVWELRLERRAVAVSIHLERGDSVLFYNTAMDPAAAKLGPGIVLELELIKDAVARGLRHYDLGPGVLDYKLSLGGTPEDRHLVTLAAPGWRGRAAGLALAVRAALRSH
jgi:CelD/BcsL family acetyltransferase involved in cellulose biosynthesis